MVALIWGGVVVLAAKTNPIYDWGGDRYYIPACE